MLLPALVVSVAIVSGYVARSLHSLTAGALTYIDFNIPGGVVLLIIYVSWNWHNSIYLKFECHSKDLIRTQLSDVLLGIRDTLVPRWTATFCWSHTEVRPICWKVSAEYATLPIFPGCWLHWKQLTTTPARCWSRPVLQTTTHFRTETATCLLQSNGAHFAPKAWMKMERKTRKQHSRICLRIFYKISHRKICRVFLYDLLLTSELQCSQRSSFN